MAAPLKPTELDHTNTRFVDPWDEKNEQQKEKKPLQNYQVLDRDQLPQINSQSSRFINLDGMSQFQRFFFFNAAF